MELSVGMYVRTEYGISKIINIFPEKRATFIETDNGLGNCSMSGISLPKGLHKGIYLLEEEYEMFIRNNVKNEIIDLIKVGDYVNGYYVTTGSKNDGCSLGSIYIAEIDGLGLHKKIYEKDIKSIVTKEQFESMSYKVGE